MSVTGCRVNRGGPADEQHWDHPRPWCNHIGSQGAEQIAAAWEKNTTVTTLSLYANYRSDDRIGDQGAERIAAALAKNGAGIHAVA